VTALPLAGCQHEGTRTAQGPSKGRCKGGRARRACGSGCVVGLGGLLVAWRSAGNICGHELSKPCSLRVGFLILRHASAWAVSSLRREAMSESCNDKTKTAPDCLLLSLALHIGPCWHPHLTMLLQRSMYIPHICLHYWTITWPTTLQVMDSDWRSWRTTFLTELPKDLMLDKGGSLRPAIKRLLKVRLALNIACMLTW
jgi:hypothetical protein